MSIWNAANFSLRQYDHIRGNHARNEENIKVSRQTQKTTNSETSQKTHQFHTMFVKFHTIVNRKSVTFLQNVAKVC